MWFLLVKAEGLLGNLFGGSWDSDSTVTSTLAGVITNYKHSYLTYNPSYYVP